MIRNNLAKLLLERNLKATVVSNETGIARSTLSKISNNISDKIDYATINTLCSALKITPNDFFEYIPIDCTYTLEILDLLTSDEDLRIGVPPNWEIMAFINFFKYNEKITSIEFDGVLEEIGPVGQNNKGEQYSELHFSLTPSENQDLSVFDEIPIIFRTDIIKELTEVAKKEVLNKWPESIDTVAVSIDFG